MAVTRRARWVLGACAAVLLAAGVAVVLAGDRGGPSPDAADDGPPIDVPAGTVAAYGRAYWPAVVEVEVGERAVLENRDDEVHTFTADDGSFDFDPVEPGKSVEVFVPGPATVAFHCELHPNMRGEIVVR